MTIMLNIIKWEEIPVSTYSGTRADERPLSLIYNGKKIEISTILYTSLEESLDTRKRARYFEVTGSDSSVRKIYHDLQTDKWFMEIRKND